MNSAGATTTTTTTQGITLTDKVENEFLSTIVNCSDDLFDWLSLKELAALNSTCKILQELTSNYVQRKYPMKCMKIIDGHDNNDVVYRSKDETMQAFAKNVRNLVVFPCSTTFQYLYSQHNKQIVSLAFYDGRMMEDDMIYMEPLLENAEIIEIQYGSIGGEFYDTVLKYCHRMKQLVIKYGFDECEKSGQPNQWVLKTYPTLEHFHWSTSRLPDDLEILFQRNPNIRSFSAGVYTAMNVLQFLLRTAIAIDELHLEMILELHDYEEKGMTMLQTSLNELYERGQFKELMLEFIFCRQLLDNEWSKLPYLTGAHIDFQYQPGASKALSMLTHLKLLVLGINTILSPAKANTLSKNLTDLEQIYVQIDSVYAIIPFARSAVKLHKFYVYRMGHESGFQTKKIKQRFIHLLNEHRRKLTGACKLIIYLPDQAYVQVKCQSKDRLNQSHIEIKRSESHVVTHPFAATKIRKDVCELYERF